MGVKVVANISCSYLRLQADSDANPIPSLGFWSLQRKTNLVCATHVIETGFSCEIGCGNGARVICLFARVIQQLGFWTQKFQANVDYCYVWRRAECTSLGLSLIHI